VNVGLSLGSANIMYMNLPEENSTAHMSFYNTGVYLFAFLGLMTGTWVSSLTGDTTATIMGTQMYSVQLTCFAKTFLVLGLGIFLVTKWRALTSEKEIAVCEALAKRPGLIARIRIRFGWGMYR